MKKEMEIRDLDEIDFATVRAGYKPAKWSYFCRTMINAGLKVSLYQSKTTVSKYVYVRNSNDKEFKVRFSNHKPIKTKEEANDCDFFVGIANRTVTNTDQAIEATFNFLKGEI